MSRWFFTDALFVIKILIELCSLFMCTYVHVITMCGALAVPICYFYGKCGSDMVCTCHLCAINHHYYGRTLRSVQIADALSS